MEVNYLDIELAIVKRYGVRENIIVPNVYINFGTNADHECDLLIIKRSGYAEEVEIKMNKADFKADFKKKHGHIDERLKYLYYAMPKSVYDECEDLIPDIAGAYSVSINNDGNVFVKCEKAAPKKHHRKLSIEEQLKIARLGVMRIWNLKKKHHDN